MTEIILGGFLLVCVGSTSKVNTSVAVSHETGNHVLTQLSACTLLKRYYLLVLATNRIMHPPDWTTSDWTKASHHQSNWMHQHSMYQHSAKSGSRFHLLWLYSSKMIWMCSHWLQFCFKFVFLFRIYFAVLLLPTFSKYKHYDACSIWRRCVPQVFNGGTGDLSVVILQFSRTKYTNKKGTWCAPSYK